MGGISGHAGLFSTAFDLHLFVKEFVSCYQGAGTLLNQEIIREFIDSGKVINEGTFLFGWDRPAENNSQAGNLFSKNSIGHLGYTGCSLWVDLARDFWVILLSNRVHPTATNEMIKAFRPGLHDQIVGDLGV
jgi:CubicO group peptidase (beta-lactamase class C family)